MKDTVVVGNVDVDSDVATVIVNLDDENVDGNLGVLVEEDILGGIAI